MAVRRRCCRQMRMHGGSTRWHADVEPRRGRVVPDRLRSARLRDLALRRLAAVARVSDRCQCSTDRGGPLTTGPRRSQRALAARQRLRETLARTERVAAAFIAADEAVAAAERKREETVERLNAEIRLTRVDRTRALAALAVTIGSTAEAAAV